MEGVEDWRGTPNHKFWLATQAGNLNAMRDIVEENKASAEPVNVDVPDPVVGSRACYVAQKGSYVCGLRCWCRTGVQPSTSRLVSATNPC